MSVAYDDARFEREIQRMRDAIVAAVKAPDGHAALEVLMQYLVATHKRLRAYAQRMRRRSRNGRSGC